MSTKIAFCFILGLLASQNLWADVKAPILKREFTSHRDSVEYECLIDKVGDGFSIRHSIDGETVGKARFAAMTADDSAMINGAAAANASPPPKETPVNSGLKDPYFHFAQQGVVKYGVNTPEKGARVILLAKTGSPMVKAQRAISVVQTQTRGYDKSFALVARIDELCSKK